MKSICKRVIALVLLISISLSNVSFAASDINVKEASVLFEKMMQNVLSKYKGQGEIDERILFDGAMKGMFEVLDPYSEYFTAAEYKEYIKDEEGFFYGIGAVISVKDNKAELTEIYKDSPAERAGLKTGDILQKVNGEDVTGMNSAQIASKVKGENETKVSLTINRAGDIIQIEAIRGKINENPVTAMSLDEIIDGGDNKVLYIAIDTFNLNLSQNLIEVLNEYIEKGVDKVIIDLRDNTGGYFTEALRLCGIFLGKNETITTMIENNGEESKYLSVSNPVFDDIIILVNSRSASASELTTAALQENNRAIVIGETTYGKSVAQNICDEGKVKYKLTMSEYLTPLGNSINGKGIEPDIKIDIPDYIYDIRNKYYLGDEHSDIKTIKEMLKYMGYTVGNDDEKYDETTMNAVIKFQADCGIGAYGGLDYTTQRMLNQKLNAILLTEDRIFNKAVEVMKNYETVKKELRK